MGYLARLQTTVSPARTIRAQGWDAFDDRYYMPEMWATSLAEAGVGVTPELAMTLSYVFSAVSIGSDDFGSMPCQFFEDLGDDGRQRVKYSDPGVGALAYRLQWQPNVVQSAKAFWSTMAWQYLLRPIACAEIIYRPGSDSFIDQLVPRHPDRVRQERLPSGKVRFVLSGEPNGQRTLTQEEMFVVRNTSTDGLNAIGRTSYGATALASGLALQNFTTSYFRKGATAALVATYRGTEMEDEDESALHSSITRYMSGVDNAGGLLLVPEDIDIKALGVSPKDAELLGLKNLSGRDVARLFKFPPNMLAIEGAQSYGSSVQDEDRYVKRFQMPMAVEFEQAIKRDLIVAKTRFFAKFNMDYLTRADLLTRMQSYEIGIRSRIIRPSDARVREDMNRDPDLDKLSESDFRPGTAGGNGSNGQKAIGAGMTASAYKAMFAVRDNAVRCLRRERHAVTKLAQKYPSDVARWQAELKTFYADHAGFVAQYMRLNPTIARSYAAQHGSEIEAQGAAVLLDDDLYEHWERFEADELAMLALSDGESVDGWFDRRLVSARPAADIHVHSSPVTIDKGAVQVDARTTVEGARVDVKPASVTIDKGAVQVDARTTVEGARVDVQPAAVTIADGAIRVESPPPVITAVDKQVMRDATGQVMSVREIQTTETGEQIVIDKTVTRNAKGGISKVSEQRQKSPRPKTKE